MTRPQLTFFCELAAEPLAQLFTDRSVVPTLQRLGAGVSLGLIDLSEERARIAKSLQKQGIPLTAWLLLPEDDGYWCNLGNAAAAARRYDAFRAWSDHHGLRWEAIGLDIEPEIHELDAARYHPQRLVPKLWRRWRDEARVREGEASYRALVERMRGDGFVVEAYQFPVIVDERRTGSTLVRRLAGLVDLPCDREVPMLYSSFVRPVGAQVLASYAPEMQAIAIGSTGGGVTAAGLDRVRPLSWDELRRDLAIASSSVDRIYLFSLEGCVRQGFLQRLADEPWPAPEARTARIADAVRVALRAVLRAF